MQEADILLVEDDASLLEITRDFLQDNGFTIMTCMNGSSALELLKTVQSEALVLCLWSGQPQHNGSMIETSASAESLALLCCRG